jgi:hypothetical protein
VGGVGLEGVELDTALADVKLPPLRGLRMESGDQYHSARIAPEGGGLVHCSSKQGSPLE